MYLSPSVLLRSPRSIRLRLACVVAAACVCLACTGEPRDSVEEASAEAPATTPPILQHPAATQDTSAIAGYLREHGYQFVEVLARNSIRYAIGAENATTAERYLVFLQVQQGSVAFLLDPIEVGWLGLPHVTSWIRLRGDDVDGVLISFGDIVEGGIATLIYELRHDILQRIYTDPPTCRPAELRDLDGDGTPELISYVEDPEGPPRNCAGPCRLTLLTEFDVVPAWVRIQRWDGEEWILVESEYSAFYRELAERFQEVDRWLRGGAGSNACPYVSWLQGERRDHFAGLAARALEVATAGQDTPP